MPRVKTDEYWLVVMVVCRDKNDTGVVEGDNASERNGRHNNGVLLSSRSWHFLWTKQVEEF